MIMWTTLLLLSVRIEVKICIHNPSPDVELFTENGAAFYRVAGELEVSEYVLNVLSRLSNKNYNSRVTGSMRFFMSKVFYCFMPF